MTAGNDVRPVTASGSVRPSDVQHHRNLRQAELEYDDLQRRQARTTVLEEIEDFEHKLGWRMRTNLGPRWEEKRYLELEEERTMGLKKAPLVRPPSPSDIHDYSVPDHDAQFSAVTPRSPNSLTVPNHSPSWASSQAVRTGPSGGGLDEWAPLDRPATGYESARDVFIVTRKSQRSASATAVPTTPGSASWSGMSVAGGRLATHGTRYGSARPETGVSHRSTRQRIKSPMQGVDVSQAGRSSGRLELWTPQSMLEPILMPASATQRLAAAKAPPLKSISKRLIETGNARRWEDGPGRRFWEVQEKNLKAAVARTQAMQRQASAAAGSAWYIPACLLEHAYKLHVHSSLCHAQLYKLHVHSFDEHAACTSRAHCRARTHTHTHKHTHTQTHTNTHTHAHAHTHTRTHTRAHTDTYTHTHTHTHTDAGSKNTI